MDSSINAELQAALWDDLPHAESFPAKRPLLAHYTSVDVLEKILKSGEIWFSNPLFMNDWEELQYGMNSGATAFRTNAHIAEATQTAETLGELISNFDSLFNDFDAKHALDTYVLCLSVHPPENEDGILSMWRGYGAGGGGVAIVFDSSKIAQIDGFPLMVGVVTYASRLDREMWIEDKLEKLARVLSSHPLTSENLRLAAYHWIERLKLFSLFTKHDGFREEQEWRIVYMSERDPKREYTEMLSYFISSKGVEPKLRLRLSSLPGMSFSSLVERIILGPSVASMLSASSIRRMLTLNNHESLAGRVVESSIPFRK